MASSYRYIAMNGISSTCMHDIIFKHKNDAIYSSIFEVAVLWGVAAILFIPQAAARYYIMLFSRLAFKRYINVHN
jgi:hypothetical protein